MEEWFSDDVLDREVRDGVAEGSKPPGGSTADHFIGWSCLLQGEEFRC